MDFSNKIIHGLWIGPRLSAIELLTINSFLYHGHEFHLWLYDTLETPLPNGVVVQNAKNILAEKYIFRYKNQNTSGHGQGSLAGFSDIFRYKLLYEKGGWWSDMDITCLKPLNFPQPYVFRNHDLLRVVGNLMKCPPGSLLMKSCFEIALKQVTAENRDWLKPVAILNDQIKKYKLLNFIKKDISNPDRWEIVNRYRCFGSKIPDNYYVLHWMNEEWRSKGIDKNSVVKYSLLDKQMKKFGITPDDYTIIKHQYFNQAASFLKATLIRSIPYSWRKSIKQFLWGKDKYTSGLVGQVHFFWYSGIKSNLWRLHPLQIWTYIKILLFPFIPKQILKIYRKYKYQGKNLEKKK